MNFKIAISIKAQQSIQNDKKIKLNVPVLAAAAVGREELLNKI
jgi:hypothetical protein